MANYYWILKQLRPDSKFMWSGDDDEDYAGLTEWQDTENSQPTKEECDQAWAENLEALYESEQTDIVTKRELKKILLNKNFIIALYKVLKELKQQDLITVSSEAQAVLSDIQTLLE